MAKYWILQTRPEVFNRDNPGFLTEWSMTRWGIKGLRREVQPGDQVAVWVSGKNAGVVAFAEIGAGEFVEKERLPEAGWLRESNGKKYPHVPLTNVRRLDKPIPKAVLIADPRFSDADFITGVRRRGNPFPVTDTEWDAICSAAK